jgi:hypothetical protein
MAKKDKKVKKRDRYADAPDYAPASSPATR